jgi:hypothetical protein
MRPRSLGFWYRGVVLLLVAAPMSRAQDFTIPPTLLLPNYDRVFPGLTEALEGGAYVARASNAPAIFYNPAGIALSDRTILNASAQGYQLTTLSGTGFEQASSISSFEAIPSFVGLVLGREVIDWEAVRLGFAVVTPAHWNQSAIATSTPAEGQRGSYSVRSEFSTLVTTFSAGWALSQSFRLGASIEFPYTSISNNGQLSGEITDVSSSIASLRSLAASGSTMHLVGVAGLQWTAFPWLELGLLVRSPGLKILSSGSFQYEAITTLASGASRHSFFQDSSAGFEYRLPLEAALGVALQFGPVQLEIDVRWHDGTKSYQLLTSTQQGRLVDTTSGTPVVSAFPFPGVPYRAHQVWNGSFGGHVALGPSLTLSAGSYLDYSPVDPGTKVFRRIDLIGFRFGAAFQIDKLSASIGAGWEHGSSPDDLAPEGPIPSEQGELSLSTFSLLFSISFRF